VRALTLDDGGIRLADRPEPAPAADTAVVAVSVAGICNTDLELVRGYMGFRGVLGHEFVGRVVAGPEEWLGKRVVGEINFACRRCQTCASGLFRHCPHRRVMGILNADGAFAERVAVPVANLHAVPDGLPDDVAVFTEPLAAAFEILEQVDVAPGTRGVVLGDGKLGLLVAQVLHQAGAAVLAVGRHEDKLGILGRRGIETRALSAWDRAPADLVVEATGSREGFALAVAATRPRGTLVLKSTIADPLAVDLAPLVINEIEVVGSRCGSFAPALDALEKGSVDVLSLVSARYPLADAPAALGHAARPHVLKVLLDVA
jgi:threonine dehydrogenase-like Zn-dependent dehydrogenase